MLTLNNIEVVYDGVILVLKGVSLFAEERKDGIRRIRAVDLRKQAPD